MAKKNTTWILIADGAQARVYANDGADLGLHPVPGLEFSNELPARVDGIVSDQEGRASNPSDGGHHGLEPRTDPRRHLEDEFLRGVAVALDKAAQEKHFDNLVLVAAPRALGTLRVKLAPQTTALVSKELDKDLVHLSEQDLERHLTNAGVLR
ncbi:MAG: host attachment protein [Rhodospirillales bacterium]|nr:host attachment protein [Rhodospirillales bacterium]